LRERFGVIRVLNDHVISAGGSFDKHTHINMEIITIPLDGTLHHIDSNNHVTEINKGDVQVISAGSGVTHAESNNHSDKPLSFLQIWIFPKIKGIEHRQQQLSFSSKERMGKFQQLVSPEIISDVLWINQDAWISRIDISDNTTCTYKLHHDDNMLMIFVIEGQVIIEGKLASRRDSIEISSINHEIQLRANSNAELLFIEVALD
jgi:redox-sensitive bicupin YhaK (pirin superfamily)